MSLDGQYASWVGTLLPPDREIVILAEPDRVEEAVMRLARVGYENVAGILEGGIERWRAEGQAVSSIAEEPAAACVRRGCRMLDVRRPREWQAFHIEQAVNIPLSQLTHRAGELDASADWAVVCASGYRSSIAASVLERAGFGHVTNAVGGMDAYRQAGLPGVATAAAGSAGAA